MSATNLAEIDGGREVAGDLVSQLVAPAAQASSKRRELSGPALRTFARIADAFGWGETERLRVLGSPARSTYYSWLEKAQRGDAVTLPLDTLLRLSALFGVWKALRIVFGSDLTARLWLRQANTGPLFGGQAPMDLLTSGTQDAIMLVRRHLDAWRGGAFDAPDSSEREEAPLTDDELVIV